MLKATEKKLMRVMTVIFQTLLLSLWLTHSLLKWHFL